MMAGGHPEQGTRRTTLDTNEILAAADALVGGYTMSTLRHLTGATRNELRRLERERRIPQAERLPNGTRIWRPYQFVAAYRAVKRWQNGDGY